MKRPLVIAAGGMVCLLVVVFSIKTRMPTSEADAAAKQYWDRMGQQCGDGYYMSIAVPSLSLWLTGDSLRGVRGLTEFKGFAHVQTEDSLTDADKLNGLEWSGRTFLRANMYRAWASGHWSQWYDASGLAIGSSETLFKRNGLWYYGAGAYRGVTVDSFRFPQRVNCAEIPK